MLLLTLLTVARKIPQAVAATLLALHLGYPAEALPQAADTAELYRRARRAETAYESSIRQFAPNSPGVTPRGAPDEIVGRFQIFYEGEGPDTLPSEPARIGEARDTAIAALLRAFSMDHGRSASAFPLVRFLVEDGRPEEAVGAARAYASRTRSPEAAMLLGYALDAARQTQAAEAEFRRWLDQLSDRQRRSIEDLGWLISPAERSRYHKLNKARKRAYEEKVWRMADPLYMTPGNEAWTAHLGRHALSRLLAARPRVFNADAWADDLRQLTVRFGPAARTTRSWSTGSIGASPSYTEHWEPRQRTYVPPQLDSALALRPGTDTTWVLDPRSRRSSHAPTTIRTMRQLAHQLVSYPDSTPRFLMAAALPVDTTVSSLIRAAVFLLDSNLVVVGQTTAGSVDVQENIVRVTATGPIPARARYYSAEIYDPETRVAARARFPLDAPARKGGLALSGLLITEPRTPGRPLVPTTVTAGAEFGIYVEAVTRDTAVDELDVDVELVGLEKGSAVTRLAGWLGLKRPDTPARVGWKTEADPGGTTPIAVTLDTGSAKPGRYLVRLSLKVPDGSGFVVAEREIRVTTSDRD